MSFPGTGKIWMNGKLVDWKDATIHVASHVIQYQDPFFRMLAQQPDVIVLTGKERGKRGVVRQVMPKKGKALVQDINISKRHMKPTGTARQAGIVDKEQPNRRCAACLRAPTVCAGPAPRARSRSARRSGDSRRSVRSRAAGL